MKAASSSKARKRGWDGCLIISKRPDWTPAAVKRFLGDPDRFHPNPHHPEAAPIRLYRAARVAEIEASAAWKTWLAKSNARRKAALTVHAARARANDDAARDEIHEWDRAGRLTPKRFTLEQLRDEVRTSLQQRHPDHQEPRARHLVGYVRCKHTEFEDLARTVSRMPHRCSKGQRRVLAELVELANTRIVGVYPELATMREKERSERTRPPAARSTLANSPPSFPRAGVSTGASAHSARRRANPAAVTPRPAIVVLRRSRQQHDSQAPCHSEDRPELRGPQGTRIRIVPAKHRT